MKRDQLIQGCLTHRACSQGDLRQTDQLESYSHGRDPLPIPTREAWALALARGLLLPNDWPICRCNRAAEYSAIWLVAVGTIGLLGETLNAAVLMRTHPVPPRSAPP